MSAGSKINLICSHFHQSYPNARLDIAGRMVLAGADLKMYKEKGKSRPLFSFLGNTAECFLVAVSLQELYFKVLQREIPSDSPVFQTAAEKMSEVGVKVLQPQWFRQILESQGKEVGYDELLHR